MAEQITPPASSLEATIRQSIYRIPDGLAENRLEAVLTYNKKDEISLNLQNFYRDLTDARCYYISMAVLDDLSNQNLPIIKHALLIEGKPGRHWSNLVPFKNNKNWAFHCYGVIGDTEGNWFAFSPANYNPQNRNTILAIIKTNTLDQLLTNIQEKDGGIWPQPIDCVQALQNAQDKIAVVSL